MFEASEKQKQAFQAATHGLSVEVYAHAILFLIGTLATIWLLLVFIGTIKNSERSIYESLYEFAFAVGLYIATGIVIYYT